MRAYSMLGPVLMMATGAALGEDLTLTVYLQNMPTADFMTLAAAVGVTAKIFAGIGVGIRWGSGDPRNTGGATVAVQFDSAAPARFLPDALGYATPFDDSHTCIHIFYNRVLGSVAPRTAPALLGHVMAHEIAHVLERSDRHSATGVMKAQWTTGDYDAMAVHPLPFTAEDVEAIREYWSGTQVAASSQARMRQ